MLAGKVIMRNCAPPDAPPMVPIHVPPRDVDPLDKSTCVPVVGLAEVAPMYSARAHVLDATT